MLQKDWAPPQGALSQSQSGALGATPAAEADLGPDPPTRRLEKYLLSTDSCWGRSESETDRSLCHGVFSLGVGGAGHKNISQ